jgi:hypothetical protein
MPRLEEWPSSTEFGLQARLQNSSPAQDDWSVGGTIASPSDGRALKIRSPYLPKPSKRAYYAYRRIVLSQLVGVSP